MLNFDPICSNLISVFLGLFGGAITAIFTGRVMVKYNEKRYAIKRGRNVFFDLRTKIIYEKIIYPNSFSKIVTTNFNSTNSAIELIKDNISKDKGIEITNAYDKYKNPYKCGSPESIEETEGIEDIAINIYDFCESEMRQQFGENFPFKTGKDLLLHNLQQIINLTK